MNNLKSVFVHIIYTNILKQSQKKNNDKSKVKWWMKNITKKKSKICLCETLTYIFPSL